MPELSDYGIRPEDLTEEEAASLAGELLAAHGLPHKIWVRGDVESELDEMLASSGKTLSQTKHEELVEWAWEEADGRLKGLSDCTDSDWELIRDVIRDTAEERYIDID